MANSDERAGQPESMEQVIALYYDQIYKFCYWKKRIAPLMRRISRRIRLYGSWMRRRHIPTLKVQRRCSIRLRIISV